MSCLPRPLAPILICVALLSACSGDAKDKKTSSQVAVKVNDGELSVHQVNDQLARVQGVTPAQIDFARKQIVEGLIDQKLLMQQAIDTKLDRDPQVLAAIEQNRMQLLAQAYLQKGLASKARASEEEVKKYYGDNPALFAERKVYRLQELSTDFAAARVDELKKVAASTKNMNEVAGWLQKNKAQIAANSAVRAAEQLPLSQLNEIALLKDGEIGVFVTEKKVTVLQVLASQPQPVTEDKAQQVIQQFLGSRKQEELARAELKRLREAAKIEYVGEFAKLAALKPDAAAPLLDGGAASAPAAGPAVVPPAPAASAVDKGVAGLR